MIPMSHADETVRSNNDSVHSNSTSDNDSLHKAATLRQRSTLNSNAVDSSEVTINIHNNNPVKTKRVNVKSLKRIAPISWLDVPISSEFKQHVGYGLRCMIGAMMAIYVSISVDRPTFYIPFLIPVMAIIGSQPTFGQSIISVWQCSTGAFWGCFLGYIAIVAGYHYNQIAACVPLQFFFTLLTNYYSDPIINRKLATGMGNTVLLVQLISPVSPNPVFAFMIVELIFIGCLFGCAAMLLPPALASATVTDQYKFTLNHCSQTFALLCRAFNSLSPLPAQMLLARAHTTRRYASDARFAMKARIDDAKREYFICGLVKYVTPEFAYGHALDRIVSHLSIIDSMLMHLLSLDWAITHLHYNLFHVRFGSHLLIQLKAVYSTYKQFIDEVINTSCVRTERKVKYLNELNTALQQLHDAYTKARQEIYYSQQLSTPLAVPARNRRYTFVRMPSIQLNKEQINTVNNNELQQQIVHDMQTYRQQSQHDSDSELSDEEPDEALLLRRDAALRNTETQFNYQADDVMLLNFILFHVSELVKQSAQLANEPPVQSTTLFDGFVHFILPLYEYFASFLSVKYLKSLLTFNHVRFTQSCKVAIAVLIASSPIYADVKGSDTYSFWAAVAVAFTTSPDSASAYNAYVLRIRGTLFGAVVGYAATAIYPDYGDIYYRAALLLPWLFYTGYQRSITGPFGGYSSMVGGFTAIIVSIGFDQTLTGQNPLNLSVKRIEENLLGILCAGAVTCFILPLRADNLLRAEIYKTIQLFITVFETSFHSYLNNAKMNRAISYNPQNSHNLTPIDKSKQMTQLAPVIVQSIATQLNYLPLSSIEPRLPPWSTVFPKEHWTAFVESERLIQMFLISMDQSLQTMKEVHSEIYMPDSNNSLTTIKTEVVFTLQSVSNALQYKSTVHQHAMYTLHLRILEFDASVKAWTDSFIAGIRTKLNSTYQENDDTADSIVHHNNNEKPSLMVDSRQVMATHNFLMSLEGLLTELVNLCQTTRLIIQSEHPKANEQPY